MVSFDFFKKIIYKYLHLYITKYSKKSYSQEAEDLILQRIFEKKVNGFYVDVGAHHPFRFSNTYLFYKKGWKGINIDAMPGSMKLFKRFRKRDINLEIAISNVEKEQSYYIFNEKALNTFSKKISQGYVSSGYFIEKIKQIKTQKLSDVIYKYMKSGQKIDFLSIDVEGLDLEVLMSNDFDVYRPEIILVENLNKNLEMYSKDEVYVFLENKGYKLLAKTFNTFFFITKE